MICELVCLTRNLAWIKIRYFSNPFIRGFLGSFNLIEVCVIACCSLKNLGFFFLVMVLGFESQAFHFYKFNFTRQK